MNTKLLFHVIVVCILTFQLVAFGNATHIPLSDMIGLYNSENEFAMTISNPIFSTLSNIQGIQLKLNGVHTLGEAAYSEHIEEPWYWRDVIGLDVDVRVHDFQPDYIGAVPTEVSDISGSFDITESFFIFNSPGSEPPVPSWDDYVIDGTLEMYIIFSFDTFGNPLPPDNIFTEPELNITSAELIITTIPEPTTLCFLSLGAVLLKRKR